MIETKGLPYKRKTDLGWFMMSVKSESIVLLANLKEALRMCANRAYAGCFLAHNEVTAVAALPHRHLTLCKYLLHFYIVKKCAVSLLV